MKNEIKDMQLNDEGKLVIRFDENVYASKYLEMTGKELLNHFKHITKSDTQRKKHRS